MIKNSNKNILITGGLGFIGSNFINYIFNSKFKFNRIINIDKYSYYSNPILAKTKLKKNYFFFKENINNKRKILNILEKYQINIVVHFAAESHVDRSISSPYDFIINNINGTFNLLEACKKYLEITDFFHNFKFIHVSTDEVFGSLKSNDKSFTESNPYLPNSPYAASKASSDLIVRSFYKTYKFPAIITNCSNNYGPYQFPEKLIPLVINNCINKIDIPVYGNGKQIRDWIYVDDHSAAILKIINKAKPGERYNIGGNQEITNLELIENICKIMNIKLPQDNNYKDLIKFVADRPGHDLRYSINSSKINKKLKWKAKITLGSGLEKTINWYLQNRNWLQFTQNTQFKKWVKKNYGTR